MRVGRCERRPVFSTKQIREFRRVVLTWFEDYGRDLPWRRTRDPYAVLVSEVMLQQTQVATVIPYYNEWLCRFPNVSALAKASEADVLRAWQGLGYYRRAQNLREAARAIEEIHGGRLPRTIEAIRSLPGVGRYTAHAVATFAFDQPVPIVETNIARVLARLFNLRQPIDANAGRETLWRAARSLVPATLARSFNSALMDLGATVCTAKEPNCQACPVKGFCAAPDPERLPVKRRRRPMLRLTESHVFIVRSGRVLLERCTQRWRGMWMLPRLGKAGRKRHPVHRSSFPFTHHRVTLQVFRGRAEACNARQRWVRKRDLAFVALPSPHRRALNALWN